MKYNRDVVYLTGLSLCLLIIGSGLWMRDELLVASGFLLIIFIFGADGLINRCKYHIFVVVVSAISLIVSGILITATITLMFKREDIRQACCSHQLKSLGLCLKQYAMDFQGWFPDKDGVAGLDLLRQEEYLSGYKAYICPSTTTAAANEPKPVVTDYEYRGGLKDTEANADLPLAWDKTGNHKEFVNVLFGDGKVLKMTQKELKELFDKQSSHK